jgi:hypothetical protein
MATHAERAMHNRDPESLIRRPTPNPTIERTRGRLARKPGAHVFLCGQLDVLPHLVVEIALGIMLTKQGAHSTLHRSD